MELARLVRASVVAGVATVRSENQNHHPERTAADSPSQRISGHDEAAVYPDVGAGGVGGGVAGEQQH